jgi:hypothetical protein
LPDPARYPQGGSRALTTEFSATRLQIECKFILLTRAEVDLGRALGFPTASLATLTKTQMLKLLKRVIWLLRSDIDATAPVGETPWRGASAHPKTPLDRIEASLEWEPLGEGLADLRVVRLGPIDKPVGSLSVTRDQNYRLNFSVTAELTFAEVHALYDYAPGTLVEGDPIVCEDLHSGIVTTVPNAVVESHSRDFFEHESSPTRINFSAFQIRRSGLSSKPTCSTIDWFLGGPSQFPWTRMTDRQREYRFMRSRGRGKGEPPQPGLTRPPVGVPNERASGWDHMKLILSGTSAFVAEVPRRFGPSWSKSLAIEYHHGAECPSEDVRDGIAEALGFLFGKQLLRVGTTSYDEEWYPTEERACDPWGRDPIETTQDPELPPIRIPRDSEAWVQDTVEAYLKSRSTLGLSDVLWSMWVARRMPGGFELPVYGSALERLMNAWYRSSRSRSKGVYIPKKEFDTICEGEFLLIEPKLAAVPYRDRIMRKLRGSFQMAMTDRFELFFEEIGLSYGSGELAAIKARNSHAHGGTGTEDRQHAADLANGYRTLVNRCVLKLLNCSSYVDYSTRGTPQRNIDEPIGLRLDAAGGVDGG